MKILQVVRRRMKKSSDFLSNQNPPGKSGCGPSIPIFPASSHAATDIRKSDQLRKFSFARQNPQQLSTCVSVGECSDQLHEGKLFNAEEFFQKRFSDQDGGDQYEREVIVRTLAAKKPYVLCFDSEDLLETVVKIPHFHADQRDNVVSNKESIRVN